MLLQKKFQFCSTVVVAEKYTFAILAVILSAPPLSYTFCLPQLILYQNCDEIGFDRASPHARTTPG